MISPLWAHHAFTAEYDARKPIDFSGAVTKVEWMNPHVYFYVQAKGTNGKTATLNPNARLGNGRTFKVQLTTGIRDMANNSLAALSWKFTT